jgi:hypothetical protein
MVSPMHDPSLRIVKYSMLEVNDIERRSVAHSMQTDYVTILGLALVLSMLVARLPDHVLHRTLVHVPFHQLHWPEHASLESRKPVKDSVSDCAGDAIFKVNSLALHVAEHDTVLANGRHLRRRLESTFQLVDALVYAKLHDQLQILHEACCQGVQCHHQLC